MGILGNEAADVLAKGAAESVPLDDHEKWMSGASMRQWTKRRKKENVEEAGGIRRVMGWRRKAVTNYCRLRGGKGIGRWWNENRTGGGCRMSKMWRRGGNARAYRVRCGNIRRVKDGRGRREWARKEGMRWDSWDALASKKWVRMEEWAGSTMRAGRF